MSSGGAYSDSRRPFTGERERERRYEERDDGYRRDSRVEGRRDDRFSHERSERRDDYVSRNARNDSSYSSRDMSRNAHSESRGEYRRDDRYRQEDRYSSSHKRERSHSPKGRDTRSRYFDSNDRGRGGFGRSSGEEPVKFDKNRRLSPFRGDTVPLEQRSRNLSNWDAAPPGFERIRADIAKQTGLFPPPGNVAKMANFEPPVLDPARAAMLAMLSGDVNQTNVFGGAGAFGAAYGKHSKRVYVGNLPLNISERDLEDYFNSMLKSDKPLAESKEDEPPVQTVVLGHDFAFVDLKSSEVTNLALQLNGMMFNGCQLKVKRPKVQTDTSADDSEDTSKDQYVLSNIPPFFQDAHVRSLLQLFGDIRLFIFLRNRNNQDPLGVVVFQFEENVFNEIAHDALNAVEIEGFGLLKVSKLSDCRTNFQVWPTLAAFNLIPDVCSVAESTVLMLINVITPDLINNSNYVSIFGEIEEKIREECAKYGQLTCLKIPRPQDSPVPGLGRVYVEFSNVKEAQGAMDGLSGRRFGQELVVTCLYPKERFDAMDL